MRRARSDICWAGCDLSRSVVIFADLRVICQELGLYVWA